MLVRSRCFLLLLMLVSTLAHAQEEPSIIDTLAEEIIYEYDTIFLQPDTIKIIDTVYAQKEITETKKRNKRRRKNLINLKMPPNSISLQAVSYIPGNFKRNTISDSISSEVTVSFAFKVQLNYQIGKFNLSIGLGYFPLHENLSYNRTLYTINENTTTNSYYDSIRVEKKFNADYYYNFLGTSLQIGKKWQINKKIAIELQAGLLSDFLVGYKQGNTNISKNQVKDFNLATGLAVKLAYKISGNLEIFISPNYQRSLFVEDTHPYSLFQKTGIGIGINIF